MRRRTPRRRLHVFALAFALVLTGSVPVLASDHLETELAEVQAEMDRIAAAAEAASANRSHVLGDISATEATMSGLLADLGRTRIELGIVQDDLASQRAVLDAIQIELRDLYLQLSNTRAELGDSRHEANVWAVGLYKAAGSRETGMALAAEDLSAVSIGLAYLDRISETTDRAILELEALQQLEERQRERIEAREAAAEDEIVRLGEIEDELAAVEAKLAERQAAVEAELGRQRSMLRSIEDEIAHFDTELDALEAEQGRIRQAIADAAAKNDTAAGDGGGGGSSGPFVRPVPGPITSPFGMRVHPILGYARMHTGLDFSAPYGQGIVASSSGTVIMATYFGGYGNTVVIDHGGGVATLYAHQSSFAVSSGQAVSAGDVVGYVGSTGLSTGAHLHFEIRINGNPVDPVPYL